MATTVYQAFQQYKSNLEITDYQTSLVSQRHNNVVSVISKNLKLYSETPSLLIGSYDRHTLTRYLYEGDVDVMVVLHYGDNKVWDTPDGTVKVLDRFRAILDTAFPTTEKRRDRNCITMQYGEFRLDVVPAFMHEGGYYKIPDSVRQTWVSTDPVRFASSITDINGRMGGTFVPLIKMVKGWNRNAGWPIRSYHLECLLHNRYASYTQGFTYSSMLKFFFECLPGYLSSSCNDPIMGDRVDTYLDNYSSESKRQIAIRKAQAAAIASAAALACETTDPRKAIMTWNSIMGEFFPAYG